MELNDYDKSRCRFHLGYNNGANLPAGDIARLEEAMAHILIATSFNGLNISIDVTKLISCLRFFVLNHNLNQAGLKGLQVTQIVPSFNLIRSKQPRITERFISEKLIDAKLYMLLTTEEKKSDVMLSPVVVESLSMAVKDYTDTAVGTRVTQAIGSMNWR